MEIPNTFDAENPLDRLPGESLRANQALRDYTLMGAGRSIRKLQARYKNHGGSVPTRGLKTLLVWSSQHHWQARVAEWERLQARAEEAEWIDRRRQVREDEWKLGSDLLGLARSILAEGPKFLTTTRRVTKDGREIITMALDGKFMVQLTELAAKLRRLSAEMETDHQRHSIDEQIIVTLKGIDEEES